MKNCPKCGAVSIASILSGNPTMSEELQDDLDSGMFVLGGCVIRTDFEPDRHCNECFYEWETDEPDHGEYVGYDEEEEE